MSLSRRAAIISSLSVGAIGALGAPAFAAKQQSSELAVAASHRLRVQKRGTCIVFGASERPHDTTFSLFGQVALKGPAATEDSIFAIGSLTKIFTTLLLANAVREGRMKLDDPLQTYMPEGVVVPSFEGQAMTLADLASHGSGLALRPPNLGSTDPLDPYAGYDEDALYAGIAAAPLTRAPGAAFEYSNFGYGLLGKALERALGQSYGALVQSTITGPLGLRSTGLTPPKPSDRRRVQGYDLDLKPVPAWDMTALVEAGGLFSTVRDIRNFLSLWTENLDIPLALAARDMLTPIGPGDNPAVRIGLGWRVETLGDQTIYWSNGSVGGCRSFMGFDLSARRAIAGFNNAQTAYGVDDICRHWLAPSEEVDMSVPVVRTIISLTPEQLAPFVGTYLAEPDDVVEVMLEGGGLKVHIGPQSIAIHPFGPRQFFIREVEVQLDFEAGADGRIERLIWRQGGVDTLMTRVR